MGARPGGRLGGFSWGARMGAGNVGYLVFVVFLIVLTVTLWVLNSSHPSREVLEIMARIAMVFVSVSFVFFAVNAILAVAALIRSRSAAKPLIGCALAIIVVPVVWWGIYILALMSSI
jgi:hypothetical protein